MKFETAMSGMRGSFDVEISKEVANILGTEHHITYHGVNSRKLGKELDEAFILFDGLTDIIAWHRYYQFQKDKQERGVNLTITGHGGEMYKAGVFGKHFKSSFEAIKTLVDSPYALTGRYGLKCNNPPSGILTQNYRKIDQNYKDYLFDYLLKTYSHSKIDTLGDKIYLEYCESSWSLKMYKLIDSYHPLLDRGVIPCGTTQSKTKRNNPFNMLYRNAITSLNKEMARVKTTSSGFTISSEPKYLLKDILKGGIFLTKSKLGFKAKEKEIHQNNPMLYPVAKDIPSSEKNIEILKQRGIIRNNIKVEDLEEILFGRLFTLGQFYQYCEKL